MAVEVAGPVLPVLVADDSAWTSPEFPDCATGAMTTLGDPPEPPLALPLPVESPPALVAPEAAGPSKATAAAATPVAPAMHSPPASRDFFAFVIAWILACWWFLVRRSRRDAPPPRTGRT